MEMNALEEQADNAKARDLHWKPMAVVGLRVPSHEQWLQEARHGPLRQPHVDLHGTHTPVQLKRMTGPSEF
jgi:hypothetical protein